MPILVSSAELRNDYAGISQKRHETGKPIFVIENGKNDAVIMSMEPTMNSLALTPPTRKYSKESSKQIKARLSLTIR